MLDKPSPLEPRPYGPDASPAEIAALRARVSRCADDIILYREAPVQSAFQLEIFSARLAELVKEMNGQFALLIDLSEAGPPTAETRAFLKAMFTRHCGGKIAAAFTGRNFMLNVAARFVLGSIVLGGGLQEFSVHRTREEALGAIHAARR